MLTLHSATDITKQVFKWAGIIIGSIMLIVLMFRAGRAIKNTFFPSPLPFPTVSYAKLPAIVFPQSNVQKNFVFDKSLGTLTGKFPVFPDRLKVYKMATYETGLLSLQHAKEKVGAIGFTGDDGKLLPEQSLGNSVFQWTDPKHDDKKIIMNSTTFDFTLTSSLLSSPIDPAQTAPLDQAAIELATNFLTQMQLLTPDIDPTKTKTQYLKQNGDTLVDAISPSDGQVTRVDFFQQDIDDTIVVNKIKIYDKKLPIYYALPNRSLINFTVVPTSLGGSDIAEANYFHQDVTDDSSTYPIKTPQEAYEDLKANNAYIAAYYGSTSIIRITDVHLGYYLGKEKTAFLLPIIVFEGNDGFVAYVSAVKDNWISH